MAQPNRETPLPEPARTLDYLRSRARTLSPAAIRARVQAAAAELDAAIAGVTEIEARQHPGVGEWTIAQVVDHVAQTTIRGADELRHLLAGRRPPAPPVYEGLLSGAAAWAPWEELVEGLQSANAEFDILLAGAVESETPAEAPTARAILVVTGRLETFSAELRWKEYALVQRLHLLDHRTQVRNIRAAWPRPGPDQSRRASS
ncbi:MAG: DinB family protein [Candidatus Rokuibacteriota bacterium]